MLTDAEIAGYAEGLYAPVLDDFDKTIQVNKWAPYVGIKYLDGYDLIVCRGSFTVDDWLRDADSELGRQLVEYPGLGMLPHGFSAHAPETYAAIKPLLRGLPLIGGAHSLGGPELLAQAGIHVIEGGKIAKLVTAASPRAGTPTLTALLAQFDLRQYVNQGDSVPYVPKPILPLLPWEWQRALRIFSVPPVASGLLAHHHLALYQQGIAKFGEGTAG